VGFTLLYVPFFGCPAGFLSIRRLAHRKSCGLFLCPSLFDSFLLLALETSFFLKSFGGGVLRIAGSRPFLLLRELDFAGFFLQAVNAGIASLFLCRSNLFGIDHFFDFDLFRLLLLTAQGKLGKNAGLADLLLFFFLTALFSLFADFVIDDDFSRGIVTETAASASGLKRAFKNSE
jgi:hypothetical protein